MSHPRLFLIPNISDTESDTFFDTNLFRYRIRYFFSIPNFFDTESDTIQKIGKVSKPIPIPIPNFTKHVSNRQIQDFFDNFFRYQIRDFFQYQEVLKPKCHTLIGSSGSRLLGTLYRKKQAKYGSRMQL